MMLLYSRVPILLGERAVHVVTGLWSLAPAGRLGLAAHPASETLGPPPRPLNVLPVPQLRPFMTFSQAILDCGSQHVLYP